MAPHRPIADQIQLAEANQAAQLVARLHPICDRLEPALDAAVQRVVVAALIVRLGGLARHAVGADGKHRVAALTVAAAVGHVGVRAQIVPARGECRPAGQAAGLLQQRAHAGRLDEGVAVGPDEVS